MPMRAMAERDWYTTTEVAKLLGVSQQTVVRCIDRGVMPGFLVPPAPGGRKIRRVSRAQLERWVRDRPEFDYVLGRIKAGGTQ